MQKRSHKLLAATLLENTQGFQARRFELAFLFGSFQPDCNPLTYLKGSLRAYKFRGHNYSNSQHYIYSRISRLQRRQALDHLAVLHPGQTDPLSGGCVHLSP